MQLQIRQFPFLKDRFAYKSALILAMCCIYVINFFVHSQFLTFLLTIMSIIVFFVSLPEAKPVPRFFGICMFVGGIILNFVKGNGTVDTANGIIVNLPLLTLVILVPLLSIPLKIQGYFQSIHFYMKKWTADSVKIFTSVSGFLFCLGPILNLGSIRVLNDMIKDLKLSQKLISKSELVGFSTVILWSPYFASVALVLYNLNVPVSDYIPLGLTFAMFQLIAGNLLFWYWLRKERPLHETVVQTVDLKDSQNHLKNIKRLLGFVVFLMVAILILERLTKWPMMYLVSLIAILYPVLWCTFKKKWRKAATHIQDFQIQTVQTMNNEIVLFISAGLFGNALTETVFAKGIQSFLIQISSISFFLFIVIIMAIILVLTFIGVHQIVVVTALVTQMDPSAIGTEPEALALLFMVSWSVSSVLSPVNPLNLLVSGYVNRSALTVGFKWNGVYLLTMLITGAFFVYLIH